jgi:hypothetical protein
MYIGLPDDTKRSPFWTRTRRRPQDFPKCGSAHRITSLEYGHTAQQLFCISHSNLVENTGKNEAILRIESEHGYLKISLI